jgi:small subunit ribosomal protein S30e
MQLFVRGVSSSYALEVSTSDSAQILAAAIRNAEGLASDDAVLLFCGGKPIVADDAWTVSSLGANATIDVTVPLVGGKVHGSLARAGKVRGQTPKVEAQEKKKRKTGRAKRRIQYNRRFVNVVQTFGRKKGPNANS